METPRYRIHHVAQITGVHPSTLRAWERRYGLLRPRRTEAGHRLYSNEDLERVRRIARLAADGIPYPRIPDLLESDEAVESGAAGASRGEPLSGLLERARRHAGAFDTPALEGLYRRALGLLSVEEAFEHVFLPLLLELGERWHAGEEVIAEEHFLSMFVRRKALAYINSLPSRADRRPVVCATAPGDAHEIGLLYFTLKLVGRGLPVTYVGTSVPPECLGRVVASTSAAAVCVSFTLPADGATARRVLADLRALPQTPAVILGGQGTAGLNGDMLAEAEVCGLDLEAGLVAALGASRARPGVELPRTER